MLSKDDLSNGATFILKLFDAAGASAQWVATLQGDLAAYWYEAYRRSDWAVLRAHGGEVFRERVTDVEAERVRKSGRCIVIHTPLVKAEEIIATPQRVKPLQPGWENDGGAVASIVVQPPVEAIAAPTTQEAETTATSA